MKGWLETDSTAALAWALAPKKFASRYDGAISVSVDAIVLSTAGDPQKLADSLLALPAGDERVKDCLPVYFELIATTPSHPDPAAIYENIPAPLRKDAWPIAMGRLIEADPQATAAWLTAHVNDPGRNYSVVRYLIVDLTEKDPAGTAQWAATFPDDERWEPWRHPASVATRTWHEKDPAAAKAWLQTQPPTLHWVGAARKKIEEKEYLKEPGSDTTEN